MVFVPLLVPVDDLVAVDDFVVLPGGFVLVVDFTGVDEAPTDLVGAPLPDFAGELPVDVLAPVPVTAGAAALPALVGAAVLGTSLDAALAEPACSAGSALPVPGSETGTSLMLRFSYSP